MKLTVLTDNHSYAAGAYYLGESGASYYIEDSGVKILLDTGYTDVYMKNAAAMGIDLAQVDVLVFSHGHDDHTGGFQYLVDQPRDKKLTIVAHPDIFAPKYLDGTYIGCPVSRERAAKAGRLVLSKTPLKLTENITYLGEIPSTTPFERRYSLGTTVKDGKEAPDCILDDSALVYNGREGIYIITCCSHSGVGNIIEYAREVTGKSRVKGLIGGLHLFDDTTERVKETVKFLKAQNIEELYPCHCTSFAVRAAIHQQTKVREVGVGLALSWE